MDRLRKELKDIIDEQIKFLQDKGIDVTGIDFFVDYGDFDSEDICHLLHLVKSFDEMVLNGVDFNHCLISYKGKRFLFYNARLNLMKFSSPSPYVLTLRKPTSPETIEIQAGIVPLAIPTKCNSGHTLVTAPNGNKVCPYATHGSDYWYCTTCGTVRSGTNITHDAGGDSATCRCNGSPNSCTKIKGRY